MLTGFGPFLAGGLTDRGWTSADIGLALTISGLAGLLVQAPAGELIDTVKSKRALVATGIASLMLAASIFGLLTDFLSVFAAAIMLGVADSVLGPGIAAISLGRVGHDALAERLSRNQRFASIGGLTAAAMMGTIGYLLSSRYIFLLTAAPGVPVLLTLAELRAADIHFGRSCGAPDQDCVHLKRPSRMVLFKDQRLLTFAICLFLFQLANASILPLIGETLAHGEGRLSSLVVSALARISHKIGASGRRISESCCAATTFERFAERPDADRV
jgi:MFS family permease